MTSLTLENYKRLRIKHSSAIRDNMFDPGDFMKDMSPFFAERERKYLAYTSEKNDIDKRKKPNTNLIKTNNKIHAGLYSVAVDQAVNHFTGIPIKWDYDVTEQKKTVLQRMKDKFFGNVDEVPETPKEFDQLIDVLETLRFDILDSDVATFQGASGVGFRLIEPQKVGKDWELWASNIEPWRAEKYENGAVFIREKYDTTKQSFYKELTVVTEKEVIKYESVRKNETTLKVINTDYWGTGSKTTNPLGVIYLTEFKNNTNRYCDFEVAEEISDAIDRSVSDQQNEIEQFKLAYMLITGVSMSESEAKNMMENLGIINIPDPKGSSSAEYVTKDLKKDFNEYHIRLMMKQFYTVTKSIDFNDEVFKSSTSGEARKWQIIALEAKTNTKEKFFKAGLKESAVVIAAFMEKLQNVKVDPSKIIFNFSRSLPTDIGYLADALPKFGTYVSKRTIQSQIPFVDDVEYENQLIDMESNTGYPGDYANESNRKERFEKKVADDDGDETDG